MDAAKRANNDIVANGDVPSHRCMIGQNHTVPDLRVVPDVRSKHQQTVISNSSNASAACRAGIDANAFADHAVRADFQIGQLSGVFQILRLMSDGCGWPNSGVWPDFCVSGDNDMAEKFNTLTKRYIRPDQAKRANFTISPDNGPVVNNG